MPPKRQEPTETKVPDEMSWENVADRVMSTHSTRRHDTMAPMSDTPGPTVRRRQLGLELRRLREAAGKTPREAADWLEISPSTLSKIELGRQAIKGTHVRLLTQLYGVGAPEADTLLRLAREANQRGWWAAYGDTVPDWVRTYLGLEEDASELWAYESGLVLGLFQTPAYAEAITAAAHPEASTDELARLVAFRTARQRRLFGDRAPSLRVVLDEAVLHRLVGGPKVMREQLQHLIEVAKLPHVDLAVQPFSAGAHPSIGSAFTLLRFADTASMNCVYLENDRGALYLERPADVDRYAAMFEQLSATALSVDETQRLMARLASEL
jgi:transcriptional regulator with XRE-family HTH domain